MKKKIGSVLLAGGKGSRLGNVNKLDMPFSESETFGDVIRKQLEVLGIPCYLSIYTYANAGCNNWTVVRDSYIDKNGGGIGPLGGILSCLKVAEQDGLAGVFVVSCDMPFFDNTVFEKIYDLIDSTDLVIFKTEDDRIHYTCGYYSTALIPIMKELVECENYRLKEILNKCNYTIVNTKAVGILDKCFDNINEKGQYEKFIKRN